jgi:predicted amidophosphoribosyltransferase
MHRWHWKFGLSRGERPSAAGKSLPQYSSGCCPYCVSAGIAAGNACPTHTRHADIQALECAQLWQPYCKHKVSI